MFADFFHRLGIAVDTRHLYFHASGLRQDIDHAKPAAVVYRKNRIDAAFAGKITEDGFPGQFSGNRFDGFVCLDDTVGLLIGVFSF